jgi:hypothetical protein
LVNLLLAMFVVAQQQPLQVTAQVDREEIDVGSEVVLTITVQATGNDPVQILDPPLNGLEIRSSTERSDVSVQGGALARITTRDLRLVPTRNGVVTIGPVRVVQGQSTAQSNSIEISVVGSISVSSTALLPHVRAYIERHPAPRMAPDEVAVQILGTTDTVTLGDQLDLIVLAWFPQDIRARLRTPPTLQPPQLQGAWIYERGSPGAVALSRRVGSVDYDVYAHHAVVFPLTSGQLEIGPATVSYSLPLTYSFLSREIRHEPQSEPLQVFVTPQPSAGRPTGFSGTAAADLEFTLDLSPRELQVGNAGSVVATLSGRGNVSLWPEPNLAWPSGIRVYPENVEVEITPRNGFVAGTKRFRYLVVADSSGTHRIEAPRYRYFDLDASRYVTLSLEPVDISTAGSRTASVEPASRALSLTRPSSQFLIGRLVGALPAVTWILIGVLPPLLVFAVGAARRSGWGHVRDAADSQTDLERADGGLRQVLETLVPNAEGLNGRALGGALRAVGVEEPVAAHVVRVRDRLWQAKYGPQGEIDPTELVAEVDEVLRALTGDVHDGVGSAAVASVALVLLSCSLVSGAAAQTPERLYETGAYRATADSFRARAEAEPWSATHQINLGTSLYRLGDLAGAKAAWIRAARLAPRSEDVRTLLELEPATARVSNGLTWIAPVTVAEALLVAALCWVAGWLTVGVRRRSGVALLLLALTGCAYAGIVHQRYSKSVGLVVSEDTALRWAPYGPAPARSRLDQGTPVQVSRSEGRWLLVTLGSQQGWLLAEEIEPI